MAMIEIKDRKCGGEMFSELMTLQKWKIWFKGYVNIEWMKMEEGKVNRSRLQQEQAYSRHKEVLI